VLLTPRRNTTPGLRMSGEPPGAQVPASPWRDRAGECRRGQVRTAMRRTRVHLASTLNRLQDVFNETRVKVWSQQPDEFFKEAYIDGDGTMVEEREFNDIRLAAKHVAEFTFRPTTCDRDYRVGAVWKSLDVHQGQKQLFEDAKAFSYITNDRKTPAAKIVTGHANQRCRQENLIEQHKNGVHSLKAPLDSLDSNWAYMVIASLAWSLKAWSALLVPISGRDEQQRETAKRTLLRMEFPTYCKAMINIPAQILRSGRRLIYRLLSWNPWQEVFFCLWNQLQQPLRC
jgi:hypothetical protein